MVCPACGYLLDVFDKECPRCHGKGIAPTQPSTAAPGMTTPGTTTPVPPAAQAQGTSVTLPTSSNGAAQAASGGTPRPVAPHSYGLQIAGAVAMLLGLLCGAYYLRFYDTSLFVPAAALPDGGNGKGLLVAHDTFLMAERQSGILMGAGLAILGAVLFGIGQYLPRPDLSAPAQPGTTQTATAQPATAQPATAQLHPTSSKTDGDLWLLYAISAVLPIGGVVLCFINRDKPERAGAAAIGTAIGLTIAVSLWLGLR